MKTDASWRQIDLHPDVADYLRKFVTGTSGLILHTKNGAPYLNGNLAEDWLDQRLAKLVLYEAGMGWHSFKGFRNSRLRAPAQSRQEGLRKFWLAHNPKDMGGLYSTLKEDLPTRLAEAQRVGYGFVLLREFIPNVPRMTPTAWMAVSPGYLVVLRSSGPPTLDFHTFRAQNSRQSVPRKIACPSQTPNT